MSSNDVFMLAAVAVSLVVAAFVTSALLCLLVRRVSPRLGFVDRPGGHKGHREPTPLGGGVAIWLTTTGILGLGILIVGHWGSTGFPDALARHASGIMLRSGPLWLILALSSVIMLMGLVDDWKTLDWRLRLGIQVSCAVALAALGVRVTLFGPFTHPLLGGAVTVLWVVGLTNSFNMLDNMDGLAASVGLIVAALFCGAELAVDSLFSPGSCWL
jgi:UDP-GlcNAc:undecaprenyl-phosphate GlcNAc-1-phosphate transferase